MLRVTVLSREGCHLCDVAMKMIRRLQEDMPLSVTRIDISADPDLTRRYAVRIPVVLIDDVEAAAGRITEGQLRRALKRARWRRPISRILSRLGLTP